MLDWDHQGTRQDLYSVSQTLHKGPVYQRRSKSTELWHPHLTVAATLMARDEGLPPTHVSVGGLNLFRDELMSFAARLSLHDVKVQSHVYPGAPRGFDGSPAFSLRSDLWSDEVSFIRNSREPGSQTTFSLTLIDG